MPFTITTVLKAMKPRWTAHSRTYPNRVTLAAVLRAEAAFPMHIRRKFDIGEHYVEHRDGYTSLSGDLNNTYIASPRSKEALAPRYVLRQLSEYFVSTPRPSQLELDPSAG
jgi:hypothetical protein